MLQITPALEAAREEARATPLEQFDVSRSEYFEQNAHWPFFDRLRAEDPVHYCSESAFGVLVCYSKLVVDAFNSWTSY